MKRVLVNATQKEQLRVALVDGQKLCNLDIESTSSSHKKGNIYKAVVTSVAKGLNAVFVEYGDSRCGFLPFRDISRDYLSDRPRRNNASVRSLIKVGDELPVQIAREARGDKGALLTTYISLVSRYLVLMPGNPRAHGVSQRIEGLEREQARDALESINQHEDEGVIVRTSATGCDAKELQKDLGYLRRLWQTIQKEIERASTPALIYQENNIVIQSLRDYLGDTIENVIIDSPTVFAEAKKFVGKIMPENIRKLQLYEDVMPLFTRYQIERQIEDVFERTVGLPSGGSLVIDHTEALTSIDINSARSMRGSNIEETALETNLEACEEIARQLRLRDLGGLIVIDFIDMEPFSHQRKVEQMLRKVVKDDRARIQLGRISRFGLLEMSRQRLRPSLGDTDRVVCPRCSGNGFIRTLESCALAIMRIVEEEAIKEIVSRVSVEVPGDVCDFLLNKQRKAIDAIENRHNVRIDIVTDIQIETPHYKVTSRSEDKKVIQERSEETIPNISDKVIDEDCAQGSSRQVTPAVTMLSPHMPIDGLFKRIIGKIRAAVVNSSPRSGHRRQRALGNRRNMSQRKPNRRQGQQQGRARNNRSTPQDQRQKKQTSRDSSSPARKSLSSRNMNSRKSQGMGRQTAQRLRAHQKQTSTASEAKQKKSDERSVAKQRSRSAEGWYADVKAAEQGSEPSSPTQQDAAIDDKQAVETFSDAQSQQVSSTHSDMSRSDDCSRDESPVPVKEYEGSKPLPSAIENNKAEEQLPLPSVGVAKAPRDEVDIFSSHSPQMVQVETKNNS